MRARCGALHGGGGGRSVLVRVRGNARCTVLHGALQRTLQGTLQGALCRRRSAEGALQEVLHMEDAAAQAPAPYLGTRMTAVV